MKFSIIIPVYKTEKYLRQCVDSVLCQSFTDFELVLVDNESPDTCPAICEEYASQDNRVRVIHKKHGTAASARNVGMKSALGDYLCFLDSDDWWAESEVLSKINQRIEKNSPDILELFYKFYFNNSGKFLQPNAVDFTNFDNLENDKKVEFLINHERLNPSAWGMCISRAFIEKSQGYFDEGKVIEDIDWCIRMYSYSPKVDALEDSIYVYRKEREGSVTRTTKFKSIDDLCSIIENAPNILCDKENLVHKAMLNYVTYQVMIAIALTRSKKVEATKIERKSASKRLKVFCKKYLKQYHSHPKASKAYKIYKIFGYKGMAFVLGFYLNHRGR